PFLASGLPVRRFFLNLRTSLRALLPMPPGWVRRSFPSYCPLLGLPFPLTNSFFHRFPRILLLSSSAVWTSRNAVAA
ncbi:MAG: hypothetical protein ACK56F_30120, partial [bacterium]